jgi:hypothetical protein
MDYFKNRLPQFGTKLVSVRGQATQGREQATRGATMLSGTLLTAVFLLAPARTENWRLKEGS